MFSSYIKRFFPHAGKLTPIYDKWRETINMKLAIPVVLRKKENEKKEEKIDYFLINPHLVFGEAK
jgi:hypothetical protein